MSDPAGIREMVVAGGFMIRRLAAAGRELRAFEYYDYAIVNDDLASCVEALKSIVRAARSLEQLGNATSVLTAAQLFGQDLFVRFWQRILVGHPICELRINIQSPDATVVVNRVGSDRPITEIVGQFAIGLFWFVFNGDDASWPKVIGTADEFDPVRGIAGTSL